VQEHLKLVSSTVSEYLLTSKEVQVLHDMYYTSRTNQELAIGLGISVNTVKTHIRHIYVKLGIGNRTALYFMLHSSLGAMDDDDESVSCGTG
jgi:DNA-binding CsgD family transcriptional regulator